MVSFTRVLQKQVSKTGPHYVLSIPREIAHALNLQDGGLCHFEIKLEMGEVVLNNYQERPLLISHFDLTEAGLFKMPLEKPVTKGPSRSVTHQEFKPCLASIRIALRFLKAAFPSRRRRPRRLRWSLYL